MAKGDKTHTDIIIFSVGNLNVGDNAILMSWLYYYRNLYGEKCRITIYGAEVSYLSELTCDLPYKVIVSNVLHRYIWESYSSLDYEKVETAVSELIDQVEAISDRFDYAVNALNRSFRHTDFIHIVGGGIINNKWKDVHFMIMAAVGLAEKYGKKIFMTGQTIGSLDEDDKVRLRPVFQKVDLIDLRDHSCEQYLKSCGCNVQVTMDDVLIHTLPCDQSQIAIELGHLIETPHINLCFQEWALKEEDRKRYEIVKKETAAFLEWYCSRHNDVQINIMEFMPLDQDMKCGREIVGYLNDEIRNRCRYVCLANTNFLWGGVLEIIKTARFNIGTRYHMALFSLENNVSTLSIVLDDYYGVKLGQIHKLFDSDGCIELNADADEKIEKWMKRRSETEETKTKSPDSMKNQKLENINEIINVCSVQKVNLKNRICQLIQFFLAKK